MVGLAGIDFTIAGANVRAHSVLRVLAGSAGLALLRYRLGITAAWPWLARLVLLTAICGSVLTWLRFLLGTIGGADSYGYVSASQILAHGRLIDTSPIADWLAAPNRMTLASPLGWIYYFWWILPVRRPLRLLVQSPLLWLPLGFTVGAGGLVSRWAAVTAESIYSWGLLLLWINLL